MPQESDLGIHLGDVHVASIGQADDTVLVSANLHKLEFLLHLTLQYCKKYNVELSPSKTKLQLYCPPGCSGDELYLKAASSLSIAGTEIDFVPTTAHVGILRSVDGNSPHILKRFTSHNRALHSILSAGLARGHRGNPAASLRVEQLYGLPVLLSGTAALVLKKTEESHIDMHYKNKLQSLMKLHQKTPDPVVYFLSGSLPASARLHLKQLSLFSMISRLPNNILHRIASHILISGNDNCGSWFIHIRDLCLKYGLPHPISQLQNPLPKLAAKS